MTGAHGPVPASASPAARAAAVGVPAVLLAGCADGQDSDGPGLTHIGKGHVHVHGVSTAGGDVLAAQVGTGGS